MNKLVIKNPSTKENHGLYKNIEYNSNFSLNVLFSSSSAGNALKRIRIFLPEASKYRKYQYYNFYIEFNRTRILQATISIFPN